MGELEKDTNLMVGNFCFMAKDAGYVLNLSKDTFIKPGIQENRGEKEEENNLTFDVSKKKRKHNLIQPRCQYCFDGTIKL